MMTTDFLFSAVLVILVTVVDHSEACSEEATVSFTRCISSANASNEAFQSFPDLGGAFVILCPVLDAVLECAQPIIEACSSQQPDFTNPIPPKDILAMTEAFQTVCANLEAVTSQSNCLDDSRAEYTNCGGSQRRVLNGELMKKAPLTLDDILEFICKQTAGLDACALTTFAQCGDAPFLLTVFTKSARPLICDRFLC